MCLSPLTLKCETPSDIRRFGRFKHVPCGKCSACIDNKRKEWYFRLKQESRYSYNAHFITLTYANEYLPRNSLGFPTFRKKDIQDFLKRFRYYVAEHQKDNPYELKVRYFCISEYGGKKGRPHYHLLIFNIPRDIDVYLLTRKSWSFGRISASLINNARIGYCANYMYGKSELMPDEFVDETNNIFMLASRRPGIGYNYITQEIIDYHNRGLINYVTDDSKKQALPRYYKDKLFDESTLKLVQHKSYKEAQEKRAEEILKDFNYLQKYGWDKASPSQQKRESFDRFFKNKVKNHINKHSKNNTNDEYI